MELIKKQIKLKLILEPIPGSEKLAKFVPDLSATYSFKLLLNSENTDWGFFDVDHDSDSEEPIVDMVNYTVTGTSTTRLNELKKYSVSSDISKAYIILDEADKNPTSFNPALRGLILSETTEGVIYSYFVDGIKYVDDILTNMTTFSFFSQGYESENFIHKPIYKDPTIGNTIASPNVDSNVFIIREEIPVLLNNYRLSNIISLASLENYAGGKFYNIVKNS